MCGETSILCSQDNYTSSVDAELVSNSNQLRGILSRHLRRRFVAFVVSKFMHWLSTQIFFNFGPLGESSITQPFDFNSSRISSLRLKSFALRAA